MKQVKYIVKISVCIILFSIGMKTNLNAQQRPNVILILSDDQGYHDLGAYGSEQVKTPALDRLASEGVRLTNFYVAPSCAPTQSMLMTGRYPQRNGTYKSFRNPLVNYDHKYTKYEYSISPERILGTDLREIFLSEPLKKGGYYNGYFGKWDLGQLKRYLPLQRGFDEFYGFPNTGIDYFTHERYGISSMYDGNKPTTEDKGTYTTTLFKREALDFLEHTSGSDRPFFLYLSFNAPHGASNLDPEVRGTVQATEKYLKMYPEGKTERETKRRGYMAAITQMDHAIGEILNKINEIGETNNTLVFFLTDNGGSGSADNSPFRGGKARTFEGGIRVPSIIKWPGHIKKGGTNDAFLGGLDIFPTIMSAAGEDLPDSVVYDGFDMLPVLQGKMKSPRTRMFWERGGYRRGARINQWKWVKQKGFEGLFNLSKDVGEENDLSDKYPKILEMMKSQFNIWQQKMKEAEPRGPYDNY